MFIYILKKALNRPEVKEKMRLAGLKRWERYRLEKQNSVV